MSTSNDQTIAETIVPREGVYVGDCLEHLRRLPDESVNCCVTSPPYWGLRDYEVASTSWGDGWIGCLGTEPTPEQFILHLVQIFSEVYRVLRADGTLWINIGDCFNSGSSGGLGGSTLSGGQKNQAQSNRHGRPLLKNFHRSELIGIPWMMAFALRSAGWILRQDLIWSKPNGMPDSATNRCTKSHEYLFLLCKQERYFFDSKAIQEPAKTGAKGSSFTSGKTSIHQEGRASNRPRTDHEMRNKRSVWEVSVARLAEAHFATFPPKLIEPCILAGCPANGIVLDPFCGSGTTGLVAKAHHRRFIGIELNPEYAAMACRRISEGKVSLAYKVSASSPPAAIEFSHSASKAAAPSLPTLADN